MLKLFTDDCFNLTGTGKSLKLASIEEVFEKAGLFQIGKWVN